MQSRPHAKEPTPRVWLSRGEQATLIDVYRDEQPRRTLALQLGLSGLRSNEIQQVAREHFRPLEGASDEYKLIVPDGKTGQRETPVPTEVRQTATLLSNASGLRKDEALLDYSTRTFRDWIDEARERVAESAESEREADLWRAVRMHDLRRTWATDTFYTLALAGVPIAEELTMGWGGWAMSATGRETFRENYLGPEPDHVAAQAVSRLKSWSAEGA